jgi:hypothetical protein
MRCLLFTAMLFSIPVGQVAGGDRVPIKGNASSQYEIIPELTVPNPACPGGIILTLPGEHQGIFSHLGRSTGDSTVIYDTCTGSYLMDITFKAANGDKLELHGSGQDQFPPGPDGGIVSLSDFEIVGGTGRFDGASGMVSLEGLRFDDLDTGTSVDTFDLRGMVSTVGSARSASLVPEPTSLSLIGSGLLALSCLSRKRRR